MVSSAEKPVTISPLYNKWSDLFSQMELPLRNALAGFLKCFDRFYEPASTKDIKPLGEFVGYDGFSAYGNLDQLLESEWLSRELDAEDFIRRIAEREVFFRKLAYENSGQNKVLAAVFDCGPWMLGHNRLVALAALFFLAARAERLGARLLWTIFNPGQTTCWQEGLTRDNIGLFLGNVVQTQLSPAQIAVGVDQLRQEAEDVTAWYIGAQATKQLADHTAFSSALLISQVKDGVANLELRHGKLSRQFADFPLPEDDVCIAALRRPFKPEISVSGNANSSPRFSTDWFEHHWMLDRANHAVFVRYQEGVLWCPLESEAKSKPLWIPIDQKNKLVGISSASGKVYLATGSKPQDQLTPWQIRFHRSAVNDVEPGNLELVHTQPTERGAFAFDFPNSALPAMFVESDKAAIFVARLISSEGRICRIQKGTQHDPLDRMTFGNTDRKLVLSRDGYFAHYTRNETAHLEVLSYSRSKILVSCDLSNDMADLLEDNQHSLFSISSKTFAVSNDDRSFLIAGAGDYEFEVPDGMQLLNLDRFTEKKVRAVLWNEQDQRLSTLKIMNSVRHTKTLAESLEKRTLHHVKLQAHTHSVSGLQLDQQGRPETFVNLYPNYAFKQRKRSIDLNSALEEATTVWLST